ncbi:MAG: flagellar basal body L-ring protein FlgH [Candidatus Thiodiazotropha weberae]|uniref:Flagellar L-ring protein n=1 Tax=Candidatus Thiodiazotropha endoloripes TaxID=1818881 RepID=A0A1E2UQ28_9GAMM|nr:flagellar basal body L-ring protein FlgH [Candidatus Thiodiazotropha endoloripes]MCG7899029.1 flagellar basal body L-ring protein FlgH [Candidatus Thiodiazotropha weberae]MCG7900784.1 flagellar basal body L-ring protein FlgH [Candidatus Thiodiazotropha weberae]MCG7915998.1 flagellar basal body L-ring protein FlgH [Candidatus Thiodiazotropha weberae]ODB85357.1 flagellar basal body L-ring protein [Candidatus Thiodiazotropha endoloripes]ODB87780.1 flagellar basal body L-ring protein [Candidatu
MGRLHKTTWLALMMLVMVGCQNSNPVRDAAYAPIRPVLPPPAPTGNGSIYQAGYENAWFEDQRARRVGDLLTVRLVESTQANKSASTSTSKSSNNSLTSPTLFGQAMEFNVPGFVPIANNKDVNLGFDLASENDFSGDGSASQSNALSGSITVSVIEVLPNRNLYVRGEKRIGINQGTEYVRLSGIVRPSDISPTNTVASTRIADPTITYKGEGALADANSMGWLSRFFNSVLSPF